MDTDKGKEATATITEIKENKLIETEFEEKPEATRTDVLDDMSETRRRTATKKGQCLAVDKALQNCKSAGVNLRKLINKINSDLDTEDGDISVLEKERNALDMLRERLNEANAVYNELLDDSGKTMQYQWFDVRDREYMQCRTRVCERIQSLERHAWDRKSVASSKKSVSSRRSSAFSGSSVRSRRVQAATKAASLQVDMEYLKWETEFKRLQLEKEIAKAKAEEDVLKKLEEEEIRQSLLADSKISPAGSVESFPNTPPSKHEPSSNKLEPSGAKREGPTPPENTLATILKLMVEQQHQNLLPTQEPPTFSGSYYDFPNFVSSFDSLIETRVKDPKQRLFYLSQYTTGVANEVIKRLVTLNTPEAYDKARKLLKERFGHPYRVSQAYKERLNNWPPIKDGCGESLLQFSDFLVQCEEAMKTLKFMEGLDSEDVLKRVSSKLPSYSGVRWCRLANKILNSEERFANFHDLVEFVKEEASLATDPVFSPSALKEERRSANVPNSKQHWNGKISYSTSIDIVKDTNASKLTCLLCLDDHDLNDCVAFKEKGLEERRNFVRKKGLCYGCLKFGHLSRSCEARSKCEICEKAHPTVLHDESRNDLKARQDSVVKTPSDRNKEHEVHSRACAADSEDSDSHSLIVPVKLYHKDAPHQQLIIYALLDPASNGTFITEEVTEKLEIKGIDTQLQLNTMHGANIVSTKKVKGLIVEAFDGNAQVELPNAFSRSSIPCKRSEIPRPETAKSWPHLSRIESKIHSLQTGVQMGLLIGSNCPRAIRPREVISGRSNDPYAVRTLLGWGIIGPTNSVKKGTTVDIQCNAIAIREIGSEEQPCHGFVAETRVKEIINPSAIKKMFETDFSEHENLAEQSLSQEDRKFMSMISEGTLLRQDNHYEMPLPFREEVSLPNNKKLAIYRLEQLKSKFSRKDKFKSDYVTFMKDVIEKGYAEEVSTTEEKEDGKKWYLPHHGVYHPKKPEKIRVVFDCSAEYQGESLNKHLLQGPDLTNNLIGVLTRFRQEHVALMSDIEGMFHQVKVTENDRDFLRFLWWEDGDVTKEPKTYRMTVHLFGATSSPGCANFALKKTADDNEEEIGTRPANFLRRNFYVDDGLTSLPDTEEAISLISDSKRMCKQGGFNLHKFISNKRDVIEAIPPKDRAKVIQDLIPDKDTLPIERALGVQWCIETDSFTFRIEMRDCPLTRRGILATVSSIYDPLGFVSPFVLNGKKMLQQLCRDKVSWDDQVPDIVRMQWEKWRTQLPLLKDFSIPRCFKPAEFGPVTSAELHHFSDASTTGYGQCSYLRLKNEQGKIHCSFVMGKARVTPVKPITIPRLELTAAVVSARISHTLRKELEYKISKETFWTDSKIVLGYIHNDARRFHTFVANRVQHIRNHASPEQWKYVDSSSNPADDASRGLEAKELLDSSRWTAGPEFLWKTEEELPQSTDEQVVVDIIPDDPEVKKVRACATQASETWTLLEGIQSFSSWFCAKRAVALCLRYRKKLRDRTASKSAEGKQNNQNAFQPVSVEELRQAEIEIIKAAQAKAFPEETSVLRKLQAEYDSDGRKFATQRKAEIKRTSSLHKLDPFLDSRSVMRVGGRLSRSSLQDDIKFPFVVPRKGHLTELLIRHFHERIQHQGRGMTQNEMRSSGFWIVGGSSAVAQYISSCVKCRKIRGNPQGQKMSDLPEDRVEPAPPFTYSAVDYFGPWHVKEGRKELKRYGVVFTCMSSRAIHLEAASSLDTDSFLNALRRFICRRGPIRQLRSDQGTNFIGGKRELREALQEMDKSKIHSELAKLNCDWIDFKFNAPTASHMGGTWERQIRTVRSVLASILEKNGTCLDDESFRTFLCEAEAIVNSRPLSVDNLNDPKSLSPLTPNHLLTTKTKVVLPPPGVFQSEDQYSRRRWRRVQHFANEFWVRWRKEFLQKLQERSKWLMPQRNLQTGDIVIIKDDKEHRNKWKLARVTKTNPDKNGLVRTVTVAIGDQNLSSTGARSQPLSLADRPVHKLVRLMSV